MAQHDMVIDNGPGLAVRTDINAAIQALVTQNSGTLEPTTKFPGQLWLDTTVLPNGQLRQRDLTNSAWIDPTFALSASFRAADIGFGARVSPNRFVWNDKADLSGTDVAVMNDSGKLAVGGATLPADGRSSLLAKDDITVSGSGGNPAFGWNAYYKPGTGWTSVDAGFGGFAYLATTTGTLTFNASTASVTPGAAGTFQAVAELGIGATAIWAPSLLIARSATTDFQLIYGATERRLQFRTGVYFQSVTSTGDVALFEAGGIRWTSRNSDGAFVIPTTGLKPGGGPWGDSSDARIKNVLGDYDRGLDAIKGLRPVRYTFKGNDTNVAPSSDPSGIPPDMEAQDELAAPYPNSPHYQAATSGTEFIGLVAQEVEAVMPGMVSQVAGYIDGEAVTDLRNLDTTNLIFALVNAVKQLAARVEALEGA